MIFFVLLALITTASAFRCTTEEDLEDGTTEINYPITPPRDLATGKTVWITEMNFFLYATAAPGADGKIHAGFWDKDDQLVYKVIVDCGEGRWKTMYDKSRGRGNVRKWKEGSLAAGSCGEGEVTVFAHVGCPDNKPEYKEYGVPCSRQAFFVVNGQVLDHDFPEIPREYVHYIEPLPVYLRKATSFRAYVKRDGVTFTRYAYGKCFDFPRRFHKDCLAGNKWLFRHSDSAGALEDFGLWSMGNNVECGSYDEGEVASRVYKNVQFKVVPDLAAGRTYKTCCCSYTDGHVDGKECRNNYKHRDCDDKQAMTEKCAMYLVSAADHVRA